VNVGGSNLGFDVAGIIAQSSVKVNLLLDFPVSWIERQFGRTARPHSRLGVSTGASHSGASFFVERSPWRGPRTGRQDERRSTHSSPRHYFCGAQRHDLKPAWLWGFALRPWSRSIWRPARLSLCIAAPAETRWTKVGFPGRGKRPGRVKGPLLERRQLEQNAHASEYRELGHAPETGRLTAGGDPESPRRPGQRLRKRY
jgi:hypothetical protein